MVVVVLGLSRFVDCEETFGKFLASIALCIESCAPSSSTHLNSQFIEHDTPRCLLTTMKATAYPARLTTSLLARARKPGAQRITDRMVDTRMMSDQEQIMNWMNEQVRKGGPFPTQGSGAGLLSKIFGS